MPSSDTIPTSYPSHSTHVSKHFAVVISVCYIYVLFLLKFSLFALLNAFLHLHWGPPAALFLPPRAGDQNPLFSFTCCDSLVIYGLNVVYREFKPKLSFICDTFGSRSAVHVVY
ncbi:hypothetical protein GCK32_022591 [Trichostrongylus colubriformis]|uniref:Uncharacterized protein n=1 Tax=Trichostrongylus colubriformis TaxID=6319 RepID=A0AAN8GA45_TRICO